METGCDPPQSVWDHPQKPVMSQSQLSIHCGGGQELPHAVMLLYWSYTGHGVVLLYSLELGP